MEGLPVDVVGEGTDAVLLLHGAFGSRESWVAVAPGLLRDGVRVAVADLPGHGRSARWSRTTLASAVDDLVATARVLGAGRLVVVGHSMGGTLLAAAEPRLLDETSLAGAVYVDAAFSTDPIDEPASALAERIAARVAGRTPAALRAARPHRPAAVVEAEARAALDVQPLAVAQLIADAAGRSLVPSFGCPSLLVLAELDSQVSPEEVELARARGARVQVVAGAGHGVHDDRPDAFLALLAAWLDLVLPRA